jgi:hypothetical protein
VGSGNDSGVGDGVVSGTEAGVGVGETAISGTGVASTVGDGFASTGAGKGSGVGAATSGVGVDWIAATGTFFGIVSSVLGVGFAADFEALSISTTEVWGGGTFSGVLTSVSCATCAGLTPILFSRPSVLPFTFR